MSWLKKSGVKGLGVANWLWFVDCVSQVGENSQDEIHT